LIVLATPRRTVHEPGGRIVSQHDVVGERTLTRMVASGTGCG
jgi:hypothetical protein